MKQTYTLFVSGVFLALFVAFALNQTRAETDSAGPKRLENTAISGIRTPVPPSADLEAQIAAKEKTLEEEKARIAEAADRLAAEDARLKLRISELEKIEAEIGSKQKQNVVVSDDILKKMVKTFETMAPKKAAGVFMTMTDDLAVELFLKLKEKKLAAILDVMDPARATQLSSLMSKRRPAGLDIGMDNEGASSPGKGTSPRK